MTEAAAAAPRTYAVLGIGSRCGIAPQHDAPSQLNCFAKKLTAMSDVVLSQDFSYGSERKI